MRGLWVLLLVARVSVVAEWSAASEKGGGGGRIFISCIMTKKIMPHLRPQYLNFFLVLPVLLSETGACSENIYLHFFVDIQKPI